MEVWTGWAPVFWPGGELVSRLFGNRVGQLALPMRPLDVARGMDSRISMITDGSGAQRTAGWLRTLRSTGEYVYSGCYSHRRPPGAARDSVHVAFPLELGNVQVFLRPEAGPEGSLWLRSPGEGFGGNGAYVVVEDAGTTYAARAPIHEPSTSMSTTRPSFAPTTSCGSGRPPQSGCTTGSSRGPGEPVGGRSLDSAP